MAEIYCAITSNAPTDPNPGRYGGRVYANPIDWQTAQKDFDWSSDVCVGEMVTDINISVFFKFNGWNLGSNTQGAILTCGPGLEHKGDITAGVELYRNGVPMETTQLYNLVRDIRVRGNNSAHVVRSFDSSLERLIITNDNTGSGSFVIDQARSDTDTNYVRNCVLIANGSGGYIISFTSFDASPRTMAYLNNTLIGNGNQIGFFNVEDGTIDLFNNILIGCVTDWDVGNTPHTINADGNVGSGNATMPGRVADSGDTTDLVDSTADFHLSASGISNYQGVGVNRSVDGYDTDIDIETRPAGAWTPGVDEPVGGPGEVSANPLLFGQDF